MTASVRRSLLVVSVEPSMFARLPPMLWRSTFDVSTPSDPELAIKAISETAFSLIISAYPLSGVRFAEFLDEIRGFGSPNRRTGLLALASPLHIAEAREFVGRGLSRAICTDEDDAVIAAAVADLFEISPRVSVRAIVELEFTIDSGQRAMVAQMVNISRSGMLIRARTEVPVGRRVSFQVNLPPSGLPLRGEGEVVRLAQRTVDGLEGLAVRFFTLDADADRALGVFVDRELARSCGGA